MYNSDKENAEWDERASACDVYRSVKSGVICLLSLCTFTFALPKIYMRLFAEGGQLCI